jgi:peptide/nickel transport system permease protein
VKAFGVGRLLHAIMLVVVSSSVAYLLAATQLNPRSRYEGRSPAPPPAAVDAALSALNMNDKTSVAVRYGRWAAGIVYGDLGRTIDGDFVYDELGRRAWVSLRLMLIGAVIGAIVGVAAGLLSAAAQHSAVDHALGVWSFVTLSTPVVVLAVVLKNAGIVLNEALGSTGDRKLLYTIGESTPGLDAWSWPGFLDRIGHLALPSAVLIAVSAAFYSRYQRSAMLDVMSSDFLRTAQAKGLRRWRALVTHGLRVAIVPMTPLLAFDLALLFVGTTFVERIFGWHGVGEYFVDAVTTHDVNSVAGVTLFASVLVVGAGFLSDLASAALDPRIART